MRARNRGCSFGFKQESGARGETGFQKPGEKRPERRYRRRAQCLTSAAAPLPRRRVVRPLQRCARSAAGQRAGLLRAAGGQALRRRPRPRGRTASWLAHRSAPRCAACSHTSIFFLSGGAAISEAAPSVLVLREVRIICPPSFTLFFWMSPVCNHGFEQALFRRSTRDRQPPRSEPGRRAQGTISLGRICACPALLCFFCCKLFSRGRS